MKNYFNKDLLFSIIGAAFITFSFQPLGAKENKAKRFIVEFPYGQATHGKSAIRAQKSPIHKELPSINSAAVTMTEAQVGVLKAQGLITSFELDAKRYSSSFSDTPGNPMMVEVIPYGIPMIQADQLSAQGGIKICIIDSGLDRSNTDFDWSNITGTDVPGTGSWDVEGGPHGTHVAGTIAALGDNGKGVAGVNSNGNIALHIVKVFNADGWGYASDLIDATQICADNGANIISMSLGGEFKLRAEQNQFKTLQNADILSIAAAGNDGNNRKSYPASYNEVVSVAAIDHTSVKADFSQYNNQIEISGPGVNVLSTFPAAMASTSSLSADGNPMPSSGMENMGSATAASYSLGTGEAIDPGAAAKICIIQRGNTTFHDKTLNCENSGGIGAVIYNNEAGMLYGTLGDQNLTSIPVVGATMEDGSTLLTSSSVSLSINSSDYGYMSGTSMATPAVSGVAALVWSYHPSCTAEQIRNTLNISALDLGEAGRDNNYGYGLVQALSAKTHIDNNGCEGGDTGGGGNDKPCRGKKCNK